VYGDCLAVTNEPPRVEDQRAATTLTGRLLSGRRFFGQGLERYGLELPIVFEQNLDFSFRVFQFFAARIRKLHAFLKQGQRLFQRHIAFLKFLHNLFEALKALLKPRQRDRLLILL
jgi:hypothetical protein